LATVPSIVAAIRALASASPAGTASDESAATAPAEESKTAARRYRIMRRV
jgi:hypothetical protein